MLTIPPEILKKLSTSDLQELETCLSHAAMILDYVETDEVNVLLEGLQKQVSNYLDEIENRKLAEWSK